MYFVWMWLWKLLFKYLDIVLLVMWIYFVWMWLWKLLFKYLDIVLLVMWIYFVWLNVFNKWLTGVHSVRWRSTQTDTFSSVLDTSQGEYIYLCYCNGYYLVLNSFCRDFFLFRCENTFILIENKLEKAKNHSNNFFARMIPITITYIGIQFYSIILIAGR